jgi:hypothetical protein
MDSGANLLAFKPCGVVHLGDAGAAETPNDQGEGENESQHETRVYRDKAFLVFLVAAAAVPSPAGR